MKMTKWIERKLSELGRITTGKTPPPSEPKFYGGNIPFVTPSDMDIRRTIDTTARYLTNAGAVNVKSSFIDKPAICVSCIGSVGKTVLVDQPFVSNQQINSIVVYEYVERLFVYYNLLGRKDEIRFKASGAVQPIINKSDFGRLTLRIPDQPTQKRIAKVLGSLDDKIELNRRMNETLEEMARALFRDWFIDFGPTRRQMDGATDPAAIMGHAFPNNKAATLAPLFPARLGDNGAPDGWGLRNLKSLGHIISGKTPSTKESKYYGSDVPFLKIPDMHGKIYVLETGTMLSFEGAASQEKKTLPKGSVSVSCIATPGLVVLNHRETQTNQQINSIVPFVDKHRYFLFWSCRELAAEVMVRGSGGSVFHNMNKTTFENLDVRFPGDKLASMLRSAVEPLHMKILVNEEENQTLAEIRDLLLPKLMSGEIQLKDSPMVQDTLDGQLIESS